jgi:hypothetical protein
VPDNNGGSLMHRLQSTDGREGDEACVSEEGGGAAQWREG